MIRFFLELDSEVEQRKSCRIRHIKSDRIMLLVTSCLLLLVVDAAPSQEQKCDNMLKSFEYLCPGKIPHCKEVKRDYLDEAVNLNWKLMVALAKAERRIKELEKNTNESQQTYEHSTIAATTWPTTAALTSRWSSTASGASCEEGYLSNGRCYMLHLTDGLIYDMNYTEAIEQCNKTGSLPAEILNRIHQSDIEIFLRTKIPSGHATFLIWTGMKLNILTSNIEYRSGARMPVYRLALTPAFSFVGAQKTRLAIYVRRNEMVAQGIWNQQNVHTLQGVLCERNI